ncbi:threonine aldolase family protein [Cohaesibacter celericrescens]|uniref:L-threonine aldolase n=1 Tax=Cohaesibacter celericrescens TaxID=2067669 RepID=A0A2N5XWX8_9HYPH|nr:low specificity L-threonine aldolase [Cohaesibacter celericrescens]PLW79016.1 low specificity L-threonine aldolase [Cohaesibacter celericrescens]
MHFASDNWAGASEPIMQALSRHSTGFAPAYGEGDLCDAIEARFQDLFETDCAVYIVATGTAANALALSAVTGPGGTVFCHQDAHIRVDECGAPEFLTSGARMWGLEGRHGKLSPATILSGLEQVPHGVVHHGQPNAISLSQSTESGTIYSLDEIKALTTVAHDNKLAVHMDGARFANALVSLNATPAEMTWKAGVDILSFGATKNGAWCAEAVVIFNKDYAKDFIYRRKRAGHLFSKMRFSAAQFEGYFENDHWLENARHANSMAAKLVAGLQDSNTTRSAWASEANEVFAIVPKSSAQKASASGANFHQWPTNGLHPDDQPNDDEYLIRLVCSFSTSQEEVDQFLALIKS